jgi:acyl-CoA synthetase (AMP-forming)/AMP-acid ligase II
MVTAVPPAWPLHEVPAERARGYLREGWWDDDSLGNVLARGLAAHPRHAVSFRSHVRPWSGTFADLLDLARRLATGLSALGVRAGDIVAFQLPNWMEAAATFYAAALTGAVVAPIVHFYGAKEVGYILRDSQARVLVTTERFGHLDYAAMLDVLQPELPALEHVVFIGSPEWDKLVDGPPTAGPAAVDPTSPALVAYTSGTTSDPKGVVHTHRTIGAEIRQLGAVQPNGPPTLVGAPVGHGIGMLAGLLLPVWRGVPIHLIDVWDPAQVLAAMLEDHLVSGTGATFFLTSLLDHPDLTPAHLELMRRIGLGGSPVPAAIGERATLLGISTVRLYGSTEHPSITGCTHDEPAAKRINTDGRALPGVELRLAPDGEILSRGPDCFAGYTVAAHTAAVFDTHGWYHTEDVGVLDDDGYLTITDRKKDVIIRGGENVSAAELEEVLMRLPAVAEVAVVAAPDTRMGEHACAFVRARPGADVPSLVDVRKHLESIGLARQKWPEEIRAVDDFPRTPSGKIKKFVLREQLREEVRA